VTDPINDRGELQAVLRLLEREAEAYLGAIDTSLARPPGSAEPPSVRVVRELGARLVGSKALAG
jgi:hypothetical protein